MFFNISKEVENNTLWFIFRFVQFVASLGGVDVDPTCFIPKTPEHSVILQYSNNGGNENQPMMKFWNACN